MWLGIVVKYVIVEDRLQESSRLKWQDAKMSNLEYCIANINQVPRHIPKYHKKVEYPH